MAKPAKFEAGKYWIGDLCHGPVDFQVDRAGVFFSGGKKCWWHHTWGGDGFFLGTDLNEYAVDAGLIGIVPASLAAPDEVLSGHFHTFKRPFDVQYTADGFFRFGKILILTNYNLTGDPTNGSNA